MAGFHGTLLIQGKLTYIAMAGFHGTLLIQGKLTYLAMAGFHGTLLRCFKTAEEVVVMTRYHLSLHRALDTAACDVALFTA